MEEHYSQQGLPVVRRRHRPRRLGTKSKSSKSKFNSGSLPLRGIMPVTNIQTPYFHTYSWRALFISLKLCMVIEVVVPILVWRIKPLKTLEIGQGVRPCEATLYQKVEIFDILGPNSHPPVPIEVKFCTAKRTQVPVGPAVPSLT